MKNICLLILTIFSTIGWAADVKISQLPLGSGLTVGSADSFPYVAAATGTTKRLTIYDLINVPALTATFAPLESPTFTGTLTAPTIAVTTLNVTGSSVFGNVSFGNVTASGVLSITNTTDSSSTITGSLKTLGGIGVTKNVYVGGSIKSETSLILEDPGAGTNTTTIKAGTVSGSYSLFLPPAVPSANNKPLLAATSGALSFGTIGYPINLAQGGIAYFGSADILSSASGATGTILQANGTGAPTWSSATYPSTTTINQINYSSSANVVSGLATANNGVLITSSGGVPSIGSTLPTAVQDNITRVGTIASGVWSGTKLTIASGGTNGTAVPASGALAYGSNGSGYAFNTPGTTSDWALSGGTGAPTFSSTTTTPKTITGSTNAIQLLVTGSSTQSADVFVVEKQDGTDLLEVTNTAGTNILGTTSNNTPCTGCVGQRIATSNSGAAENMPSTGVIGCDHSITLTAGSWLMTYGLHVNENGATVSSAADAWIGTASGNAATGRLAGTNTASANTLVSNNSAVAWDLWVPNYYVAISATTTYYQKCRISYSGGPPTYQYMLQGVRIF